MATYRIYSLSDPRDGLVRYVGRTKNPVEVRFKQHWKEGARHGTLGEWLAELKSLGLRPVPMLLQEHDHPYAEWFWISKLKEEGHPIACKVLSEKFPYASVEEAVQKGVPDSPQVRWNRHHRKIMLESTYRWRKGNAAYSLKHAEYQRTYGLKEKRLSLFNPAAFRLHGETPKNISKDPKTPKYQKVLPACVGIVPVLYRGPFTTEAVSTAIERLKALGSVAAPGFMDPEGLIVFHEAGGHTYKVTVKDDDKRKSE